MRIIKYSNKFTDKDLQKIANNLNAFENNFEELILFRNSDKSIMVYQSMEQYDDDAYIQRCENIDYFNGWLYGAVQALYCISKRRGIV